MTDDEKAAKDARLAAKVGQEFTIDATDCCLEVAFTARLVGVEWVRSVYTGGPHKGEPYWFDKGYRFDNGVVISGNETDIMMEDM